MSKSKSMQARLVSDTKPAKKRGGSISAPADFGRKLLRHHNPREAADMVAEQAGLEFDREDGAELEQTKQALSELNTRHRTSAATLDELEKKKAGTRRYIKSSTARSGKDSETVRWSDWRTKDQILLCGTLTFFVLAVCMGAGSVYANLMSSGNPVFLDDKWLAVMLSTLLPIGSAAIKFITNFMTLDKTRKRYAMSIYVLTLMALLVWSVLFSMNFTGVSGGIDWNELGESNDSGAALVWAQLIVEMLAASALFLAAEDIYIRYSPDMYTENFEYIEIEKALKNHLTAHEKLCQERAEKHGLSVALNAKRIAFINNKIADYVSLRGRFDAANDSQF